MQTMEKKKGKKRSNSQNISKSNVQQTHNNQKNKIQIISKKNSKTNLNAMKRNIYSFNNNQNSKKLTVLPEWSSLDTDPESLYIKTKQITIEQIKGKLKNLSFNI